MARSEDVGLKPPSGNGLGLFDMSGSIAEWSFTTRVVDDVTCRKIRGGSWKSPLGSLRVGNISAQRPFRIDDGYGLRLIRSAQ